MVTLQRGADAVVQWVRYVALGAVMIPSRVAALRVVARLDDPLRNALARLAQQRPHRDCRRAQFVALLLDRGDALL
jgi:hypothetical protein